HVAKTDYVYRDDKGILAWLDIRDSDLYKFDPKKPRCENLINHCTIKRRNIFVPAYTYTFNRAIKNITFL
ncbi:MAG: hypothetical protein ACFNL8_07260, partial [Streptococcus mutans]